MTAIHGDAMTAVPTLASTTVDAAEALCFARDLGGSLTHVLVAAAGRALAVGPTLGETSASTTVGLVVGTMPSPFVAVLPGACAASLPALRAEIDAALRGGVDIPVGSPGDDPVALVIVETDRPRVPTDELLHRASCVLEAGPYQGDPLTLMLALHADRRALDPARAEALLHRIARLLVRPYRRLQ
jgi:hypothetical protein